MTQKLCVVIFAFLDYTALLAASIWGDLKTMWNQCLSPKTHHTLWINLLKMKLYHLKAYLLLFVSPAI
jgi:hypothetical protein